MIDQQSLRKKEGTDRIAMDCAGRLKELTDLMERAESGRLLSNAYTRRQAMMGRQGELVQAHSACKQGRQNLDFYRKQTASFRRVLPRGKRFSLENSSV